MIIQHDGNAIEVLVCLDVAGDISLAVYDGEQRLACDLPPMTPFEASMLARDLNRAAEKTAPLTDDHRAKARELLARQQPTKTER